MTHQFFEGYDVHTIFQQMAGIGVAQCVYAYFLDDPCIFGYSLYCPLHSSLAVATIKALTLWIATAGKQPPFRMFGCYVFFNPRMRCSLSGTIRSLRPLLWRMCNSFLSKSISANRMFLTSIHRSPQPYNRPMSILCLSNWHCLSICHTSCLLSTVGSFLSRLIEGR